MSNTTNVINTTANTTKEARKRHKVFMWTFLAIQVVFLAWIIFGVHSATSGVAAGQQGAADLGATIGAGMIIGLWAATDVILGVGRWVVLTARKRNN